ncbi:MAG: IS3 family transposase [Firmicutes bacterium]|nr:IS3 family transposase [Bacillota bacterium]
MLCGTQEETVSAATALAKSSRSKVCRLLNIPRSTLYYRLKHPRVPGYTEEEAASVIAMFREHHGSFGRRVLHRELAKSGEDISEYKISRIMHDYELVAKYGRKRRTNIHTHKECVEKYIAENTYWNLPEADRPRKAWSMDFTEQKVEGRTVYTCGIISITDKILVGRITGKRNCSETACEALRHAIKSYGAPEMLLTDRGSPFVSKAFHDLLEREQITHSMSRPHTPRDNRYIETFWRIMKTEIGSVSNMTRAEYFMVLAYYENYYNYKRPHSALDYATPCPAVA